MSVTDKLNVLQTEHLDASAAAWLASRVALRQWPAGRPGLNEALADVDGLVVRTYTSVDEQMLSHAPRLKVVGRAGAGLDNIDVEACRRQGVEVVYTPDANTQSVVEYVLRLILATLRPVVELKEAVESDRWRALRQTTVGIRTFSETRLGILGMGRIGRRVAAAAAGLGCRSVRYHDIIEIDEASRFGAEPVSMETLFSACDIVSVHVDGRASNRHLVSGRLLALLPTHAIVLNTSRGFVVDNLALAAFLRANTDAVALLDVHEPEPISVASPLLGLPNARLMPHLASRTVAAMAAMSEVVQDVWAVLDGREPRFPAPIY